MTRARNELPGYLLPLVGIAIAFAIGYIHHHWFYPAYFHGDAAAMHVLAKSIIDERSILPHDFSFGNQLVILRSSPFIALSIAAGFSGYQSFIIGSALSIAFWGGVMHCFLATYFRSHKQALLFATILLIPLGIWELDFVLGQQSHLTNAVLALGIITSFHRYASDRKQLHLIAGCVCLFIMSVEAPIRGLLVLVPALAALALTASAWVVAWTGFCSAVSFCLGYLANKALLQFYPIGINHFDTLTFKSSDELFANLVRTSGEAIGSVSSMNIVAGSKISAPGLLVFGAGLLLVLAYLGFILVGAFRVVKLGQSKCASSLRLPNAGNRRHPDLLPVTAVLGIIVGAIAVSALNPDSSRHYLWAVFLIKLSIFISLYHVLSGFFSKKAAALCVLATSLILSAWFANLAVRNWRIDPGAQGQILSGAARDIDELSKETGIRNVYGGDFWRMMPLNATVPGINAQPLGLKDGGIIIEAWLTRLSWACAEGEVLYFLKNSPVDKAIKERLQLAKGRQLRSRDGYSLWAGLPVWRAHPGTSCYKSSLVLEGDSFLALPSTVGANEGSVRKTNEKAGYLVFGPYAALKAGRYQLDLLGSAQSAYGARLEVVSNNGTAMHARFDLKQDAQGRLLRDAAVQLPTNVSDLEVRVLVNEQDSLQLQGYSLRPVPEKTSN